MDRWLVRLRFDGRRLTFLSEAESPEKAIAEVRRNVNALAKTVSANIRILAVLPVRIEVTE